MRKVLVNKKGNYQQLRILFPDLHIADNDIPVYSKIIYSTFDYDSPKSELFLLQDPSGFLLDTPLGLGNFLRDISYMQDSKIDRLLYHKRYGDDHLVYELYKEAVVLKLTNKSLHYEDQDLGFTMDMLKMSLSDRLVWASRNGYQKTLESVIGLLEQYFIKEVSHFKPIQFQIMGDIISRFDRLGFKKDFSLSGDAELDCLLLLTYFH